MINVTKPYLPNKKKYKRYIDEIYESNWLTNKGPKLQKLEQRLAKYLGVKNIILVANGTLALEISYRALEIKNSAITTPFSFIATASSLLANNIKPIFADINPKTFNIDPKNIEKLITNKTSAIVPVHVFANACEIEEIEKVATKHNLKVVYDAAHCFGVDYKNQSILNYGDISTLSFHATKIFHTIEGGAIITKNDNLAKKIRSIINFGIKNENEIPDLGTNAKMNEFEAAMGLCVLDEIEIINEKRKNIFKKYSTALKDHLEMQKQNENSTKNYSYFPILLKNEISLLNLKKALNKQKIYPRRYFYPSLDSLNFLNKTQKSNHSRDIASRILCLPIYPNLKTKEQNLIISAIKKNL